MSFDGVAPTNQSRSSADSLLAAAGGVEERRADESASTAEEGGTQERTSGVKLLLRIFLAMVRKGFF